MAYTFLTAINNSLKRVQVIQGATGALTTFTAPAIQTDVDVMIMAWNEVIQDIATLPILVPGLADQGTQSHGRQQGICHPRRSRHWQADRDGEAHHQSHLPLASGRISRRLRQDGAGPTGPID